MGPRFQSTSPWNMAKFLRPGKVVVVLNGRFAGKKAVIVKNKYRSSAVVGFGREIWKWKGHYRLVSMSLLLLTPYLSPSLHPFHPGWPRPSIQFFHFSPLFEHLSKLFPFFSSLFSIFLATNTFRWWRKVHQQELWLCLGRRYRSCSLEGHQVHGC